jgi:hypothetical protein
MILAFLSFHACEPTSKADDTAPADADTDADTDTDTDTDADTDTDTDPSAYTVVGTTSDYTSGSVATIDAQTGALSDSLVTLGGDAIAVALDSTVYVLGRSSENTVRAYTLGDWSAPAVEFSTGDGTNPADVATCDGKLFVSLYDGGDIGVYDPSNGSLVGRVDLSAYADSDGSANPADLYAAPNGALYVALSRYDYGSYWSDYGMIAKIDCDTFDVLGTWQAGVNTRFSVDAGNPDVLVVSGDNYALDGAVYTFDTGTDTLSDPLVTEADLGMGLGPWAGGVDGHGVLIANDGTFYSVWCVDTTSWELTEAAEPQVFVAGAAAAPDGTVWVAQRSSWGGGEPVLGFVPYDPAACSAGDAVPTALEPYSVTIAR